ncbi:hypothetical protein CTI12_AA168190 [Artemisia annua]|uniref:GCF C-terminal domain-containing protein n=1 Tax=Artemisia annua TaxID=35608 RepID=A0A2U1MJN0_ARTAN|nr:hypothetical protein CTI12_AA168190 [Artemisia annua]
MRGKQVKVLTSLENLNDEEESIPMADLMYNVRLLVSLCEVDILKIDQDLKIERGVIVALRKEKEELEHDAARQDKQLYSLSEIANELERVSNQCRLGLLTLESVAKSFGDLQKVFPEEYKLFRLSTIACSFALDLFRRLFLGWDPLVKPEDDHQLSVVSIWKDLLQDDEISDLLYSRLLMEVVFPVVRTSITNTWQPKHPEPLLRFLDLWEELLPQFVLQTILDHVVMPKLSDAVDSWDPRQDTIPIHVWIHPWLVLLGHKLEVLYPTIRTKLEHVLRDWHPSDASAYTVLSPWKDVFNRGTWEQMMISCIAPKLLVVMRELEINPADQKLEHFYWVQTWVGLIPVDHMLHIMDVFFDKWQMALYKWLCSNPNYQEVNDWFVGWRSLIPSELLSTERVRCQLKVGLDMMNQAVEGLAVVEPGLREHLSDINARNQSQFLAQQKAAAAAAAAQADKTAMNDMSLKEVIEVHAQHNDLLFKPKPGRMQDGHQVYGFGNISIIIDALNQKVFAQTEEGWSSVTLEKLVMLGKTTAIKRR